VAGRRTSERILGRLARRLVSQSDASVVDYLLIAFAVALAAGLRELAGSLVASSAFFAIFYPVVLIAALMGGVRLGLFALGLSGVVVWWLWLPGLHHGPPLDRPEAVTVIMFVLTAGLMLVVAAAIPMALRRTLAAEERFRLAQEASLDAFVILEPIGGAGGEIVDFQCVHANAAANALAPREHRPLAGRRLLSIFPDVAEGDVRRFVELLRTGAPDQVELPRRIDGVDYWLRSTGVRIGDCVGLTFRDVSELVEARHDLEARVAERTRALEASLEERAHAEAALARAQRLETVGRLTGGVAHDFNNLLTVVIGGLDMLLRATDNPERVRHLASAALAAARRGEQLTRQLLAFSRHKEVKPEMVSVAAAMAALEPLLRRVVDESIRLTIEAAPDTGYIHVDTAQFESALLNLVVNAADATQAGGAIVVRADRGAKETEAADRPAGDYVTISVADTGAGMTPEVLEHVFEPYFTTKPIGKGTGLGLAQVYGFVRHAGGVADVASAPGVGTTVSLRLPAVASPVAAPASSPAKAASPVAFADGRMALLVEDEPTVQAMTRSMLGELGFQVLVAADGHSALSILRGAEPITLLFSDVVMPGGMTGVELAEAAQALRPDLSVLLTTGYAAGRLEAVEGLGRWPVVRKPYRADELAASVWAALRRADTPAPATD
jgi:signal transduction histidine kinase/ActR/RegA family two-component response regulator